MTQVTTHQGWRGLTGIALLACLLLSGCTTALVPQRVGWLGLGGSDMGWRPRLLAQVGPGPPRSTGVEASFTEATPEEAVQLRRLGVTLPHFTHTPLPPRRDEAFVDSRVYAVGFGITAGGYVLYCKGVSLPVLVPESHVDLGLEEAQPLNGAIYPDREKALADVKAAWGNGLYAYHRGAGGLVVPTVFSPATTPNIAQTMLAVRQQLSETVEQQLTVLLVSMTGTRVLGGLYLRALRVGTAWWKHSRDGMPLPRWLRPLGCSGTLRPSRKYPGSSRLGDL